MSFYLEHDIGIKGREKGRDSWKKSGAETRLMAYSLRVQRTVYVRTYLRFVRSFSFFSVTYLFAFSPVQFFGDPCVAPLASRLSTSQRGLLRTGTNI